MKRQNQSNRSARTARRTARPIALMMSGIILCSFFALFALPVSAASSVRIRIDGREATSIRARMINGTTYVPFRSFADTVTDGTVTWNAAKRTATLRTSDVTVTATVGKRGVQKNGISVSSTAQNRLIGGTLYIPVRPIANALGYSVAWEHKTYTAVLTKKSGTSGGSTGGSAGGSAGGSTAGGNTNGNTANGSTSSYTESELYWLSRIIEAEAGGEPYRGKLAVGTVVMNRVKSTSYPNTIYGVIFDRKYGVQFTPAYNGMIYKTPSASSIAAAKEVLNGYRVSGNIQFFLNPALASSKWFDQNLTYVMTIGNHRFYAP